LELIVALVLVYFIGLGCGAGIMLLFNRTKKVGSFKINHSDPTTDFVTLALDKDIDVIEQSKYISLKVEIK
jgi:hypothetical protein